MYRNITLDQAKNMSDENILRIELGNCGEIISEKTDEFEYYGQLTEADAANMTDAEILKLEGINTPEEHQIPSYPPRVIDALPVAVPQIIHHDNEDNIEILPDEQVDNLPDDFFFPYRLRLISFLRKMELQDTRYKFTILVDYSIGMFNRQYVKGRYIFDFRWAEAKDLASALIPSITKFNYVGVSLHFFSRRLVSNENVRTSDQSMEFFNNRETKSIKSKLNFNSYNY